MDMDPQILIELTKIISEQNENPVRIEKNLVQKNPPKDKTRSYNVQLGSSTLIISKTNNSQWSEAKHQKFLDQLDQFERQKKLYYQILETEEPLTSSKYGISVRGGELGKSGPGPRAKADALKNARKTGGGSIFAQSFTPQPQYCSRPINRPLSCRNHAKLKNNPFDNNQDPRVGNNAANTNSQVKKDEVAKLSESVTKSYSEIKHELEIKQHQKTVKIDVAGKTYMIENADRMGVDQLENKLAEQMYNSIRDNHKDISDIAGNLGFKADNIKNVKDHVFYNEHVLDRYAHLGDDPVVQRFDPDLKQALAWKRFEIGEHTPEDMEWLKHEYAERFIESTYDAGYTESHDRAQSRFDGNPWNDD